MWDNLTTPGLSSLALPPTPPVCSWIFKGFLNGHSLFNGYLSQHLCL